MLDIISYMLGITHGKKTQVINADDSSFSYDAETKTGTLTVEGGESDG